jgi:hypothetical protein
MGQYKDGDSKTLNGVTYVRQGGVWMPQAGAAYTAITPPDPTRQAAEQRSAAADARAAAAAHRSEVEWNASHNPDGSPKVQAPSLLGDQSKTGAEYLATLPPNIRNRVQQLIDGRSLLTAREKGTPLGQQLMDAANQADPTFDENVMHARYVERTQYTGQGKGSQAVQAAERIAQHLNDLYAASKDLGGPDLGFTPLSNLATGVTNSFRQAKVARYNQILPLIAGELQKLTKNGSATVDESNKIEHNLQANQPEDVRNAAMKEVVRLGRAQYDPLRESWASAWQGSAPPPMPMDFSPITTTIFDNIENDGDPIQVKRDKNGSLIPLSGSANPPAQGVGGGNGVTPPGGPPRVGPADYSGMVGGPQSALATTDPNSKLGAFKQTYRNAYDPVGAGTLSALIRKAAPYKTAATWAQSHDLLPPDPKAYRDAVAFAKQHNGATNVDVERTIPTTFGERVSSSPAAAAIAGSSAGATAGFSDVLGRAIAGDQWDANRAALAATNPGADLAGNLAGGAAAAVAPGMIAAKYFPKAAGVAAETAAKLGKFARPLGDVAYGSVYGANESPDNPLGGAIMGGITGGIAGSVGRKVAGGVANAVAPPAGDFGPLYAAGGFPTIGQRFAKSGVVGRAINGTEQAMQSMPGLGAMVARARDIPREAAQLGAFNQSLGELKPFDALGLHVDGNPLSSLPLGMQAGTDPHAFVQAAFQQAYPMARQGMKFVPDQQFGKEVADFTDKWRPLLNGEQQRQLQDLIKSSVGTRLKANNNTLSGDAYHLASSDIGNAASTWSKSEPTLAQAAGEYQDLLDTAAKRSSDPQAAALLDAADRGWAKYAVVRNAAARPGGDPGTFTMKALQRGVQQEGGGVKSGPFLRGQALMQDYSNAVQPLGDSLSNSGTGERLLTNKLFLGEQAATGAGAVGTGLGGALLAHPGALVPFLTYAPGVNKAVTRAIAPRSAVLPAPVAEFLEAQALRARQLGPYLGSAAVPAAITYRDGQ